MPSETTDATLVEIWRRRCEEVPNGPYFDNVQDWLMWWHGFPLCTLLPDACGERAYSLHWDTRGDVPDDHAWVWLWGDCGVHFRMHAIRRDSVPIDGIEIEALEAWAAVDDGRVGRETFIKLLNEPAGTGYRCKLKNAPHAWLSIDIVKAYGSFDVRMFYFKFGPDRVHEWYCTNRSPKDFAVSRRRLLKKQREKSRQDDIKHLSLWYRQDGERGCNTLRGHWRRSGEFVDFATSFCNILNNVLKDGGCPQGVINFFVNEVYARLWAIWLRDTVSGDYPVTAPRKWPQDKKKGENIKDFIEATYGEHIKRGMNRVDVRKLDPKAVKALEIWAAQQRAKGADIDINAILPRRSLKVDEVLESFATAGEPITERDWRVRGVETPEAQLRVRARRSAYRRAWGQRRKAGKPDPG